MCTRYFALRAKKDEGVVQVVIQSGGTASLGKLVDG